MTSSTERIFILGGTGNIGTKVVKDLIAKNIPVTLFARSPAKVESLFSKNPNINIIQGDISDLTPLKAGIQGHTRVFLLLADFSRFVANKKEIAQIAYQAGVKQIVDISSFTVNLGWRTSYIGSEHAAAEEAIYRLPNRGYFVALRPGFFMSNVLNMDHPKTFGKVFNTIPGDRPVNWISTNDIGAVAAVVLTEDVEKHRDAVYTLEGDLSTCEGYTEILTRLLGKEVKYQRITPVQKYTEMMQSGHANHLLALDLSSLGDSYETTRVTPEIEILLGRAPETLEEYLTAHRDALK